jgi:flagellar hook protein FlgE
MLSVIMSGLKVAQKDLAVTANNLANSGTVGFKRSDANFVDVFASDPSADPKTQVGAGAIADIVQRSMTQGPMTSTDRVTDLAIAGRGFFVLSAPVEEGATVTAGNMYTRAGNFGIDATGKVVDNVGNQLQVFEVDDAGAVNKESLIGASIPSVNEEGALLQSISISSKGVVQARYADDSVKNVGVVALASFPNDGALKAIGGSKFIASGESGEAVLTPPGAPSAGDLLSATLEEANVDITQELMGMLRAQQIYNGNARMLQAAMEVASRVTDKL